MDSGNIDFKNVPMLWKPDGKSNKRMSNFIKRIEDKFNLKFEDYWDLHKWTVDHIKEFWAEIWEAAGVIYSKNYEEVVDLNVHMSECRWFEGARLNYAENLLKYRDDHIALVLTGEDKETKTLTYYELYEEAKIYAAAFRKFGIRKGDIVMCYMSNRKEAILGMLAATSIGAIFTGALPQLGPEAVLNRMKQVYPKLLLTIDRFMFDKKEIEMLSKVERMVEGLPSLQKVLIIPTTEGSKRKDISVIKNSCFIDDFLKLAKEDDGSIPEMVFEQVSVSHPIYINFTSGTTGLPKALVCGSGLLLKVFTDYCIHIDATRESTQVSLSPVGWASWCFYSTHLFLGQTTVLHEGSPFLHSPTSVWDIVDEFKITHLMLMSSVADELEKRSYLPTPRHHLTSLKFVMIGGSVVKSKTFDFFYNKLKLNVIVGSLYGCTEIMICHTTDTSVPVHKGEVPAPTLATCVECYDEVSGLPVLGEVGDLVLSKPLPGMILGLWGDEDGSIYREKYYSKYPGKFYIGDHGIINPFTKGLYVLGRSDDTLKQRGCRIGVSEIYDIVDRFPEIYDSICVSQFNEVRDERAVLFLKMREGHSLDNQLVKRIREKIAAGLTPRHVPDLINQTEEIPYNTNSKKMESIVKKIINNLPFHIDSVSNPDSLKCYQNRIELQEF